MPIVSFSELLFSSFFFFFVLFLFFCFVRLQGDAARPATANEISDPLQRQMAFMAETQAMVKDSQAAIRAHSGAHASGVAVYHSAKRVEHLEPMFGAAAFPVLAPLSVLLGQATDPRIVAQVLRCFEHAICIAVSSIHYFCLH